MMYSRRSHLRLICGALAAGIRSGRAASGDISSYHDAEKENFLKLAKILAVEQIGHGVTKPLKVKLELNGAQHLGQIQTVDKDLPDFFPQSGPPVPMRDSWRFNVAAYKIDRLLSLNMVPVTVQRTFKGKPAAFTWWVDDVMFEEVDLFFWIGLGLVVNQLELLCWLLVVSQGVQLIIMIIKRALQARALDDVAEQQSRLAA